MRSKIINNSVTANYSKFDLDLLIKAAVGIYAPLAKQKSVTMIYENPGNHIVYADRKLIEVTIDNLLSNAVKFTPHGGDIIIDASDYPENLGTLAGTSVNNFQRRKLRERRKRQKRFRTWYRISFRKTL